MGVKLSKATICSLCGMAGVVFTGLLAFRAGKKVQANPAPEKETKKEKAVRVVKTYGPPVASGAITCVFIFAGDRIHVKKEIALGAAVAMWKDGYLGLEKAAKEVVGEEKMEEINAKVKENFEKPSNLPSNTIKVYEPYTDQFIFTTSESIAWVALEANRKLNHDFVCPINFIVKGLGGKTKPEGEEWIWDCDSEELAECWGYYQIGPWIDVQLIPVMHGPEQVLELHYTVEPVKPRFEDKLYKESN